MADFRLSWQSDLSTGILLHAYQLIKESHYISIDAKGSLHTNRCKRLTTYQSMQEAHYIPIDARGSVHTNRCKSMQNDTKTTCIPIYSLNFMNLPISSFMVLNERQSKASLSNGADIFGTNISQ